MGEDTALDSYSFEVCVTYCEQIPKKCPNLLTLQNESLKLTCIDANDHVIVCGSNFGNLFALDRNSTKLTVIKGHDEVTVVKLSRDLHGNNQLAVGLKTGTLVVLRVPFLGKNLIEKSLRDVHKSSLTCLHWSENGNKIFSGDSSGLVMLTLVDFDQGVFHSSYVCCEECPIRQIDFRANFLVVCTEDRLTCIDIPNACQSKPLAMPEGDTTDLNQKVGWRGVTFAHKTPHTIADHLHCFSIVSTMSDLRLVKIDGNFAAESCIDLLPSIESAKYLPVPEYLRKSANESLSSDAPPNAAHFGLLKVLDKNNLVTVANDQIFMIDVITGRITKRAGLFTTVYDFCCTKKSELFLLCGSRIVLRLAETKDDALNFFNKHSLNDISNKGIYSNNIYSPSLYGDKILESGKHLMNRFSKFASLASQSSNQLKFVSEKLSFNPTSDDDCSAIDACDALAQFNDENIRLPLGANDFAVERVQNDKIMSVSFDEAVQMAQSIGKSQISVPVITRKSKVVKASSDEVHGKPRSVRSKLSTGTRDEFLANRCNPFLSDDSIIIANGLKNDHFLDLICSQQQLEKNIPSRQKLEELLDSELKIKKKQTEDSLEDGSCNGGHMSRSVHVLLPLDFQSALNDNTELDLIMKDNGMTPSMDFDQALKFRLENYTGTGSSLPSSLPTTSPTLCRHQLSSDTTSAQSSSNHVLFSSDNKAEIWCSTKVSNSKFNSGEIRCVSGSSNYVCVVDSHRNIYYADFSSLVFDWKRLEMKADKLAVSNDGKNVWIISNRIAYSLVEPLDDGPIGTEWVQVASNIRHVSFRGSDAWYLTMDNTVHVQRNMGTRTARPENAKVECTYNFKKLCCNDQCVWALTESGQIMVRIGLNADNWLGDDWADISFIIPTKALSVSLYSNFAWIIDDRLKLRFLHGVCSKTPLGRSEMPYEVYLPQCFERKQKKLLKSGGLLRVFALPCGLWIIDFSKRLYYRLGFIVGHRWPPILSKSFDSVAKFKNICASNVSEEFSDANDRLWLQSSNLNEEIMAYQLRSKTLRSISTSIAQKIPVITATFDRLWVLDSLGQIFYLKNIRSSTFDFYSKWNKLDLTQFSSSEHLIHICGSQNTLWACDVNGRVYVRFDHHTSPAKTDNTEYNASDDMLIKAWLPLEPRTSPDREKSKKLPKICKVYCSCDAMNVWALDELSNILVRMDISLDLPIGSSWDTLDDLRAVNLAVGRKSVWALDTERRLFIRHGISESNALGNYWRRMPGRFNAISCTADDQLWALNTEERLVKHESKIYENNRTSSETDVSQTDRNSLNETNENEEDMSSRNDIVPKRFIHADNLRDSKNCGFEIV